MRRERLEAQARVERECAGIARRRDEVQARHTALAQRRDERLDEPATPALPLKLGQQIDVEVRGVAPRVRLGARAPAVRVAEDAVLTCALDLGLRPALA